MPHFSQLKRLSTFGSAPYFYAGIPIIAGLNIVFSSIYLSPRCFEHHTHSAKDAMLLAKWLHTHNHPENKNYATNQCRHCISTAQLLMETAPPDCIYPVCAVGTPPPPYEPSLVQCSLFNARIGCHNEEL